MKTYKYGMRLRGYSPGCQPMDGLIRRHDDPTNRYYDILEYERALTENETQTYSLDEVKPSDEQH